MLAKIMRYDSELDLTEWEHCVICEANIMIKMMNRGDGLYIDDHGQVWDRIPPEATSMIQAGESSDTSKGDGSKGKRENNKRKKRNRNRGKTKSQPSSTLVLSDEPAEPTKESTLSLSGVEIVATVSPIPLEETLSLLSLQSADIRDVTNEIHGALTLSKIMNVAGIQPSGEHPNKEDKAVSKGTPGSFEHKGNKSRAFRHVRADIDALP